MNRREFLKTTFTIGAATLTGTTGRLFAGTTESNRRLNVLFIAVDDMNDWTTGLGGYAGKVHTPNQQRLAEMGMEFTNAHTVSPVCCPSRAAILTGLRPSTSGIYNNSQWLKPYRPDIVTIPVHFREHGYYAAGAGKIFHHTAGNNPPYQWDEFQRLAFNDALWVHRGKLNYPWSKPAPAPKDYPFCGIKGVRRSFDWGTPDKKEEDYDDARTVDFAIEFLKRKQDKPFFLACGIFRPHLPWYVPKKYFDMYPLDEIKLPTVPDDDMKDIPKEGIKLSKYRRDNFEKIKKAKKWKHAVQAYLACITFADAQLGRLLDAFQQSPFKENTIIVFWSDHGWHLGEKNHWHKKTLWEEATRVPFYIYVPGITKGGQKCERPVGLIDIYPTLIGLCNLNPKPELDGLSLVPLLKNPDMKWDRPAITEYKPGQFAVRSQRWRYIRYSDGTEELYDHQADPNEWTNLANKSEYDKIKKEHARWIPKKLAEPAPSKSAYIFDYKTYTWTHKKTGKKTMGM